MKLSSLPAQWPVLLIPTFFLLNASNEYFGDLDGHFYLRMGGYLLLLLLMVVIINVIIFRNKEHALAFSFISLIYLYFTKNLYKLTEPYLGRSTFFILCAVFVLGVFLLIRKLTITRSAAFNKGMLLIISALVIFETGVLLFHTVSGKKLRLEFPDKPELTSWQGAGKPNIYLLLFDEYQGNEGLRQLFGYNNSLTDFLEQKQFRVVSKPRSNYNYTYFSVPSMFAMSYLDYTDNKYDLEYKRVVQSINALKNRNYFTEYLKENGYRVRNFSLFDFAGIRTPYDLDGLDEDAYSVLFSRTLPGWLKTDILHQVPYNSVHKMARDLYFQFYDYNLSVLKDSKDAVGQADDGPVFVYSHFLLPHLPVVTDSTGRLRNIREAADDLHNNRPSLKQTYLWYTKYANKVCSEIVDEVIEHDANAVIIIVSDHGLRRLIGSNWVHDIQMAVRMPGRPDPGFYDEMTTVNLLRIVLNNIAGQKLGMLPDSVVSVR